MGDGLLSGHGFLMFFYLKGLTKRTEMVNFGLYVSFWASYMSKY